MIVIFFFIKCLCYNYLVYGFVYWWGYYVKLCVVCCGIEDLCVDGFKVD